MPRKTTKRQGVIVYLDFASHRRLTQLAKANDRSVSQEVRLAVQKHLQASVVN